MYSVSSSFLSLIAQKNASIVRRFYIGSSDYSAYVLKYPSFKKQWDGLKAETATLDMANDSQAFNFLSTTPTKMRATCSIKFGTTSGGTEELITAFAGTIDSVKYSGASASLTLIDKFRRLSDRKVGDSTVPVSYTASNYLIHNLAWYACTSLGGLSAIASTSNPDIDYGSFSSWTSVFSADNVRGNAHLTGQQPIEILKKLASLTQSAIYIENDKIKFNRFSIAATAAYSLGNDDVLDTSATLDDRGLINRQFVSAAYNVSSKSFGITVQVANSGSVNSYGVRESLVADQFVWLTDSVAALNLGQRTIDSSSEMIPRFTIKTPMHRSMVTVGDTLAFTDALLGVGSSYRVMEESLDLDAGIKTFVIDKTQYKGAFTLDVSALDGTDALQ